MRIETYDLAISKAKRPIIFCGFCASEWDKSSQIHPDVRVSQIILHLKSYFVERNFERSIHDGCTSLGMDSFVRDLILSFVGNDFLGEGIHEKILEEWEEKCDALAIIVFFFFIGSISFLLRRMNLMQLIIFRAFRMPFQRCIYQSLLKFGGQATCSKMTKGI